MVLDFDRQLSLNLRRVPPRRMLKACEAAFQASKNFVPGHPLTDFDFGLCSGR
eukprot:CAMPEP_0178438994 /NCGR_PEP_ID=MMETSP0689_2-20121128/35908_1 /TAXON_ID=160604 /ORGANISM="Amphidinium massartii, Strain CS-259" /LENGTH=52 /DNA_ID=CAMNT_0020061471 /DNA_START=204 /DNA_END=362 /DNA_ORIENTATION=-